MRGAPRAGVGGLVQSESVPVDFTAIDFETANASSASACAVGLVRVRGGGRLLAAVPEFAST